MDFFYRYKKILMIIGFIGIVILLGYALYLTFFKAGSSVQIPAENDQSQLPVGKLPGVMEGSLNKTATSTTGRLGGDKATGDEEQIRTGTVTSNAIDNLNKVKQVTNAESFAATLSANKSGIQYYNKTDGRFYKIDSDGQANPLSGKVFHSVQNVVWSPTKNKAVLEYPDGSNVVYDFNADKQTATLPSHWEDFNFSPDGSKLVMKSIGIDPGNRWLGVTNEDGSKTKKIESIGENADKVMTSWSPNNQTIAMYSGANYTEGESFNRQEVFFVGLNHENFKSMTIEGRGFQPMWSPEGDRLVYSVYSSDNNMKPMLWVGNAQGDAIGTGRKKLGVETWADKCTFADTNTIYCAVPDNLQEGAGLFPEMAQNTSDKLYAIDTRNGAKKIISTPEGSYTISNIIIADDGQTLYFQDTNTKKIYNINLK